MEQATPIGLWNWNQQFEGDTNWLSKFFCSVNPTSRPFYRECMNIFLSIKQIPVSQPLYSEVSNILSKSYPFKSILLFFFWIHNFHPVSAEAFWQRQLFKKLPQDMVDISIFRDASTPNAAWTGDRHRCVEGLPFQSLLDDDFQAWT
jgi:hypothetical protein